MSPSGDAEDYVVAGETDFDVHAARGHGLQQTGSIVFVGQVDSMSDALGAGDHDRVADVMAEPLRLDESRPQLARVRGEMDLRIELMEEGEHLHLIVEVVHR